MMDLVRSFIGVPPEGYEWLEYAFNGIFFLLLFRFVSDLFRAVSAMFNRG